MLSLRFASRGVRGAAARRPMSASPAALVKQLRAESGAPMMECKRAIDAVGTDGGMQAALEWLRKRGTALAAKKAGREALQGLVGVVVRDGPGERWGAAVEVNSETDFVSRNETFLELVESVARAAAAHAESRGTEGELSLDELRQAVTPSGATVADALTDAVTAIRENIVLRRASALRAGDGGAIEPYVHGAAAPARAGFQAGRIGTLVAVDGGGAEGAAEAARGVAMHVAAAAPRYLARGDVPAGALEHERGILREQALAEGKPDAVADKIVEGRLGKFFEEQCLLEQQYVVAASDAKPPKVADVLPPGASFRQFVRMQCGETVAADAAAASK